MESSEYEDILADSLEFLGGKPVVDDEIIRYGPLSLTVAQKIGKANTLLADHLFSPSLFLAERIERGLIDPRGKTVLELGAGAALPSLLLSTLSQPPSLVVVTDYPDEGILGNLQANVLRNRDQVDSKCRLLCKGYDWGTDASSLLSLLPPSPEDTPSGYDILILSDLLHFHSCHDLLVASIEKLLKRSPDARVQVSAGVYTKVPVCNNFLEKSLAAGLTFEEIQTDAAEGWLGTLEVSTLDREALATRKAACRYWIGRWSSE